jgi:phage-related protein
MKADIAFGELKETLGAAVLPAIQGVVEAAKPLVTQLVQLASKILPPLLKLLEKLFNIAGKVAGAIGKIADAVGRLTQKIKDLLAPLGDAVNKLKNLDLNPFSNAVGGVPTPAGITAETQAAGTRSAGGPVTINIYGDPAVIEARVIRALRGYQFRNGAGSVFNPGRV